MYRRNTWPATRKGKSVLYIMEMKMLRWLNGCTLHSRKLNEIIKGLVWVAPTEDKLNEIGYVGMSICSRDWSVISIG